jgi:uncharacterized protein (TIGR02217 family)
MAITVLSDLFLPNSVLSSGVRGKNIRQNSRVVTENGFASVNIGWSQSLRQFELGTVPMKIEQWQAIEALHEITRGGAFGFLMFDPKDSVATPAGTAVKFMPAVGTAPAYYQIQRRYIDKPSGRYLDRPVTRPIAAEFVLYAAGAPMAPGSYTINPENGRLTFSGAAVESLSWSGRFAVPVHFMDDSIDWDLIAPGGYDQRFLAGPSVVLQEIREALA